MEFSRALASEMSQDLTIDQVAVCHADSVSISPTPTRPPDCAADCKLARPSFPVRVAAPGGIPLRKVQLPFGAEISYEQRK
jgi:hypothetical protein